MDNPFLRFIQDLSYWGMERFGKYYSSYRAFVYEREDPEGMGRLQLIIPHLHGPTPYKYWAFPVGIPSGFNYGWHWIPQKGEMVMVEFEAGNPNKPMWKYGHHAKTPDNLTEIPPDMSDPDLYWFRTPKGLGISFNDKTGEIKMLGSTVMNKSTDHTITVGNNTIHISDSGINITAGEGNKIYLGGQYPVLYSKVPFAEGIQDLSEIGVSNKVRIG